MKRGRPRIYPEGTEFTNVSIEKSVKTELEQLGEMSDTYNSVIIKLIASYKKVHKIKK